MGIENRSGWHVSESGENPLKDAGEKELEAVAKGLAPEGKRPQKLAPGEAPLSEASDVELTVAVGAMVHGRNAVEGGKGMLADATEAELEAAVETLGGSDENPLEKLVAKVDAEQKSTKPRAKRRPEDGPQDQA